MLRPLTHFFALGAACFLVSLGWSAARLEEGERVADDTIVISDAEIAQLTGEWMGRFGSGPNDRERQALIDEAINDEILFREAVRLRMHLVDPVVRRRLTDNMRFLNNTEGVDSSHDEALLGQALDLGMARTDLVVRRRLIQQMRLVLEAMTVPPSLEEGREYVQAHPDQFSTSRRFAISYRFERRDARATPAGQDPADGRGEGTAPLHSELFSVKQLSRAFGQAGAEQIASTGTGEWTGPVHQSGGAYWVRLDEVIPERPIEFEYVRERALHTLTAERSQRALARALANLRRHYRVRIAGEVIDLAAAS